MYKSEYFQDSSHFGSSHNASKLIRSKVAKRKNY